MKNLAADGRKVMAAIARISSRTLVVSDMAFSFEVVFCGVEIENRYGTS